MNRIYRSFAFAFALVLVAGLALAPPALAQEIRTADYDVEELDFPPLRDFEVP